MFWIYGYSIFSFTRAVLVSVVVGFGQCCNMFFICNHFLLLIKNSPHHLSSQICSYWSSALMLWRHHYLSWQHFYLLLHIVLDTTNSLEQMVWHKWLQKGYTMISSPMILINLNPLIRFLISILISLSFLWGLWTLWSCIIEWPRRAGE